MSKGICGNAKLVAMDDGAVLYEYCCYNLNLPSWESYRETYDGELCIDRSAFVEPEIHVKQRKTASRKRETVVKRIPRDVDYDELFKEGGIRIKNASGTWRTINGRDEMALHLLYKLFREYQDTGEIPQKIGYFT